MFRGSVPDGLPLFLSPIFFLAFQMPPAYPMGTCLVRGSLLLGAALSEFIQYLFLGLLAACETADYQHDGQCQEQERDSYRRNHHIIGNPDCLRHYHHFTGDILYALAPHQHAVAIDAVRGTSD